VQGREPILQWKILFQVPTVVADAKNSWPLLHLLGLDWATSWAILQRVWQLLAGAVTIVLMTRYFDLPTQGYYYLFSSLIALQTFFELGLSQVVVNVCSHEWAVLRLEAGYVVGDATSRARLISLGRQLLVWFTAVQMLFFLVVGSGGAFYLGQKAAVGWNWQAPWWSLVLLTAWQLWMLPWVAMLEGCNQVAEVNAARFLQIMIANVAVWIVIVSGGGIWALAAAGATRVVCDGILLGFCYRRFFAPFWSRSRETGFDWRREIWPMQWRVAVSAWFAYFGFFLLTPVMFEYHGPRVAGQMGMTWTVVTAVQAAALAWVQTRTPRFGMLIREQRYEALDRLFVRVTGLALIAMLVAGFVYWCLLIGCLRQGWSFADRVLPPLPTALLLLAGWVQVLASALVSYVRAHKQEPFLIIGMLSNALIGLAIWVLGARYGPTGAGIGLLGVVTSVTLPVQLAIWRACRASHGQSKLEAN